MAAGALAASLWLSGGSPLQAQTTTTLGTTTTTAASTTTTVASTTTTVSPTTTTTMLDCGPITRVVLPDGSQLCAHPEDPGGGAPRATPVASRVSFTG